MAQNLGEQKPDCVPWRKGVTPVLFILGFILDDDDLVETLTKSKSMSTEIRLRVLETEDMEKKLNLARQKYLPVTRKN